MFPRETARDRIDRVVGREVDEAPAAMSSIATTRHSARTTLRSQSPRKLTDREARRYAFEALAALGTPDRTQTYRDSYGGPIRVGPYITEAVRYVLRDADVTSIDREVVLRLAHVANVAMRDLGLTS